MRIAKLLLNQIQGGSFMKVREIMTSDPACCTPDSTLQDVAKMMDVNDCGLIPVVDSQISMKPIGTITDRDIAIRTVAAGLNPIDMRASDVMTPDAATVTPELNLEQCFGIMEDREIRRVLVVDDTGKCCGIVAQADIVRLGISPVRTAKVIREISESSPSDSQLSLGGKFQSAVRTAKSSGSVIPLLLGVGSGMGLMYWLGNNRKSTTVNDYSNIPEGTANHSSKLADAVNHENFGQYLDAEKEVEKRQHGLQDRVNALKTEQKSTSPSTGDETINDKGKGRGVGTT
jgi:CBS domain-containing protein